MRESPSSRTELARFVSIMGDSGSTSLAALSTTTESVISPSKRSMAPKLFNARPRPGISITARAARTTEADRDAPGAAIAAAAVVISSTSLLWAAPPERMSIFQVSDSTSERSSKERRPQ